MASVSRAVRSRALCLALAAAVGATLGIAAPAPAQNVQTLGAVYGDVRVRGAGVVSAGGLWFQLLGVTSPEREVTCPMGKVEYQCGLIAQSKLAELAGGKFHRCDLVKYPPDTRLWATCAPADQRSRNLVAGAISLNQQWVRSGWGMADAQHTDAYVADETGAKTAKLGLWSAPPRPKPPALAEVAGPITVIDGRTIEIKGVRILLFGIDAPEIMQGCSIPNFGGYQCGPFARYVLTEATEGQDIYCRLQHRDGDDRNFGVCGEADAKGTGIKTGAKTLNEFMVGAGWAVADRAASNQYVDFEIEARNAKRGMWVGNFALPRDWREGVR